MFCSGLQLYPTTGDMFKFSDNMLHYLLGLDQSIFESSNF